MGFKVKYDLYVRGDKFANIEVARQLTDLELINLKSLLECHVIPTSHKNIQQKIPLLSKKVLLRNEYPIG